MFSFKLQIATNKAKIVFFKKNHTLLIAKYCVFLNNNCNYLIRIF